MNVSNKAKKLIAASALSVMMGMSSFAVADEALQKIIDSIKTELAEHTGVMGGFDRKHGVVTLSGHTSDIAGLNDIIAKIKSLDGVNEVYNNVTRDDG